MLVISGCLRVFMETKDLIAILTLAFLTLILRRLFALGVLGMAIITALYKSRGDGIVLVRLRAY